MESTKTKKKTSNKRWINNDRRKTLIRALYKPGLSKRYLLAALGILILTTIFWSVSSAQLQASNADQLVNPFLLENSQTFQDATLPGAHSFLFKWPLFFLVKIFGYTSAAYVAFTVGITLITVLCLAAIMYWIERRPLVFGTLCLALASVLLMIPAQPYAGAVLPVNMAMLATRNLEYILYIVALIIMLSSSTMRGWKFWSGVGLMGILIASDKLFMILGLTGAFAALMAYSITRHWKLVTLSVKWLAGGLAAAAFAMLILGLIDALGLTNIVGVAGPYGLVHSLKDFGVGSIYSVLGILTNLGANPAYDATLIRDIPGRFLTRLLSVGGPAYLVNMLILLTGLVFIWRQFKSTLTLKTTKTSGLDTPYQVSLALIWTSLAALAIFIISSHYYAVDARYLSISLFTLFIAAATYTRNKQLKPEKIVTAGLIILAVIIFFGLLGSSRESNSQKTALADVNSRNKTISQVLQYHKVEWLVGDYWRVIPVHAVSDQRIQILPMEGCTEPRQVLSSQAWQPDLHRHSFAYLLSLDGSLTDYPSCNLDQVVKAYGRPNTSTVISGSLRNPKELLLFYDKGAHKSSPTTAPLTQKAATVVPINPEDLPYTSCSVPSVLNVVAHEDDDLLFMNPDILNNIKMGHCVRTMYVTAGDDGAGKFYWLSRERGSEAAYSAMLGKKDEIWIERIVKISDTQYATVANPKGNSHISLIFLHLPDGNLKGDGFNASNHESLERLESGRTSKLHAIDGQSVYNSEQVITAIKTFMHVYQPAEIRTQSTYAGHTYTDHSDHRAVGRSTKAAYTQYINEQYEGRVSVPFKFYLGYPTREFAPNVGAEDLAQKEAAFLTYAKFDSSVCSTSQKCAQEPTYGSYLRRQYISPN